MLSNTNIDTVEQQVGRAELGEDPWGPNRSEFHVDLKPISGEEQEKMEKAIDDILKKFPGIQFGVTTFLGDRIGETLTGETAPVVVNIFGDDLDLIDAKAQRGGQGAEGRARGCRRAGQGPARRAAHRRPLAA